MKTKHAIMMSGVLWCAGALYYENNILAAIFAIGHILFWQSHVIEVKLNMLLDDRGLFVSEDELNR